MIYPVTTEATDHPGGYQGAMDEFYAAAAERLATHLEAGRNVVVLAEGDPLFYGSYMHMHKRLAHRFQAEVVPGITSFSAAAAALGRPLVERDEVLTVLPGTLHPAELARRLEQTDAAVVMKLGRTFEGVREGFEAAGKLDRAWYVERASSDRERTSALAEVDPQDVPYMSIALMPGPLNERTTALPEAAVAPSRSGEVVVVGLGPGPRDWTTPEVQQALSEADDLVGYVTYLNRVPVNPRQERHASDNKVESERAAFALDLALRGRRVVVVSSGDPGVFAMASAVLEVADEPVYKDVPVRVLPGVSAAQAVAARAGAPLGHDFCTISLSDRLKRGTWWNAGWTRLPPPTWSSPSTTRPPRSAATRSPRPGRGAAPSRPGHSGDRRPGGGLGAGEGHRGPARRARSGAGRHAHAADHRLVADPDRSSGGRFAVGLDAAPLPGLNPSKGADRGR